jgi:hypothetical protein
VGVCTPPHSGQHVAKRSSRRVCTDRCGRARASEDASSIKTHHPEATPVMWKSSGCSERPGI